MNSSFYNLSKMRSFFFKCKAISMPLKTVHLPFEFGKDAFFHLKKFILFCVGGVRAFSRCSILQT